MIDIHNHILPGLDDGASDLSVSLAMARQAHADGITQIIATPHRIPKLFWSSPELRSQAQIQLQEALDNESIPVSIHIWTELYEDRELARQIHEPHLLIGTKSKYCLMEFAPMSIPLYYETLLGDFFYEDVTVVIAHPERNFAIISQPRRAWDLVQKGALLQVNAGSLLGKFGPLPQMTAELLLCNDLVHFIASDAHDAESRPLILSPAVKAASKIIGTEAALKLVTGNPERLLSGDPIRTNHDDEFYEDGFFRRLRRKFLMRFGR